MTQAPRAGSESVENATRTAAAGGQGRGRLLLLTDFYPYEVGEEFLEQEIETLCAAFEEVVIVPVRLSQGARQTRPLPPNARCALLPASRLPDWRAQALLRAPQILLGRERMVETPPWRSPGRFGMDVRFAAIALSAYSRMRRLLPSLGLEGSGGLVIYSYWFFTGAALGGMLRRRELAGRKVRVVARAHAYDVDERDAPRGYVPARRFVMRAVDRVYPISQYAAGFLHRRFPGAADRIEVRRLGVPAAKVTRRRPTEPFQLVSCSHMAPYKRVDLIVAAVAELERRGRRVAWTHIGEFDAERLEAMRERARAAISHSPVTFTGHMTNAEVRELYASTDFSCFLNCSDGEGVPVSVMEAQATGLPVVATAAGGTGEIVHDGVNGRLIPVEVSAAQIADAVESVIDLDEQAYEAMSREAHATWARMSDAGRQYREFTEGLVALEG
ncbi:glycosyltransferase [Actinomyces bowdenii]|uniref:glycosyltransferase n=1 Tax=Actinomyces bowdenii TaxID=131109 RepID=UPI001ABCBBB3|nr:glycosyltransferase [Actinomyces bowdenii]MBO3725302.1 glycosyltransferase [Actinomyces bowdenii]